jgi:hypothetical protein
MAISQITNKSITDATITAADMATGAVEGAMTTQIGGRRNLIINGAMQVAQRGTSAITASGTTQFPVDRFGIQQVDVGGSFTAQQSSTAPEGHSKSVVITVTGTGTPSGGDRAILSQHVEGLNSAHLNWGTANAKTVTLSFWVRSSLTGTFGGALSNSSVNRAYPFTYSISSADTWEQKTVTISGDTSGTWLTTNGVGVRVYFGLSVGPDKSGTAGTWASADYRSATGATNLLGTNGATFYITGVQLEVGSVATPFEHRSYGEELAACQRYYYQWNTNDQFNAIAIGMAEQSNELRWVIPFHTEMRAKPAQSLSAAGDFTAWDASHSSDLNTRLAYYAGKNSAFIRYNANTSGFTIGRALVLYAASNANAAMKFDAEL